MHELAGLIARAQGRWHGATAAPAAPPRSAQSTERRLPLPAQAAPPAPAPATLTQALTQFVRDEDLRLLLAGTKARHDALPPRDELVVGQAALWRADPSPVRQRYDYGRPMHRIFQGDNCVADSHFWQWHLRKVPFLARLSCHQVLRERVLALHWRQAVAVVIGKWDGQIQVDRIAMTLKIARNLQRAGGKDPREHPAYRVVMNCTAAAEFAGVDAFLPANTGDSC